MSGTFRQLTQRLAEDGSVALHYQARDALIAGAEGIRYQCPTLSCRNSGSRGYRIIIVAIDAIHLRAKPSNGGDALITHA